MAGYIEIKDLRKSFDDGRINALNGVNLEIDLGEFVAIMGPSGCGKSTLLNMIGALDKPDSGEIVIDNKSLSQYKDLSGFRSKKVGYVFQLHNLIPTLTASENVQIPLFESKVRASARKQRAADLLKLVGLEDRANSLPARLSGGERQRVATARALVNDPEILIADEPTGSLDSKSSHELLEFLKKIHKDTNNTIIMVTHDSEVASYADRVIYMLDGKVQ